MNTVFLASLLLFSVTAILGASNDQLFLRHNKTRESIAPKAAAVVDVEGRDLQSWSTDRCGSTWSDANSNCHAACDRNNWDDPVCDGGNCWGGLSTASCSTSQGSCQYCEGGVVGNGVCKDSSQCCSTYGWCGTSSAHCGSAGTCGGGSVGNGICSSRSLCCSKYGYCGTTSEHCGCSPGGTSPTPAPVQHPTTKPPTNSVTCTSPRCGVDWSDANSKCGTPCTSNAQCTVAGEGCYADVSRSLPCCDSSPVTPPTPPTPTPPTPTPPTPPSSGDKARLIAYVGNWQQCPTMAEIAKYTHIVVAFSVAYTWSGSSQCNTDCSIPEPPTCGNAVRKDLIAEWKAAGKKVLLSFGGANMGGSWLPPPNGCWEYCYNKGPYVIQRLKDLVTSHGYNGVDIDYEYYYDSKNGFTKGSKARNFLTEITTGLKNNLPAGSNIVTHAPMDADVVTGTGYYTLLKSLAQAGTLDFLMPQYYNGVAFPATDFVGTTLPHYTNLVNDMFGGDAKRVVFGFCLAECNQYNTDGAQAASIMNQVGQSYPCNGGAFFWEFLDDMPNNAWSTPVKTVLQSQSNSCS